MTVSWLWIVAGLGVLALLGLAVAVAMGRPVCLTCGGRVHARRCPWRKS